MKTALIIFVITYALISVRGGKRIKISRSNAALLGGVAMILFGVVSLTSAFESINFNLIFLLLGMMSLAIGLEYCGLFEIISNRVTSKVPPGPKLLAVVMALSAMFAALIMNDATALLLTPVVIRACMSLDADPLPYLMGTMMGANIGSLSTAVGNPKNAFIVSESGISFIDFTLHQLPIVLISLPIVFFILAMVFRKRLKAKVITENNDDEVLNLDKTRLIFLSIVSIFTFIGFILSSMLGISLCIPAVIAGLISVAVILSKDRKRTKWIIHKIDWHIPVFFIGLFILMDGVATSGLLDKIADLIPGFGPGEIPSYAATSALVLLLANLISNLPAIVLIINIVPQTDMFFYTLSASATLAGNATLLGSACNIIVSEKAAAKGIDINFWKHMSIGIPVTFITIAIQLLVHSVIF
ncbi:MAG: SLC13 family permease [Candidatus Methanomethylophilaceae archaeon]